MECLEQIVLANRGHIDGLRKVAHIHPNPNIPASCQAFSRQVRLVEGAIVNTYSIGAQIAKDANSLKDVAAIWKTLSLLCNEALSTIRGLKDQYPYCGAPELYDLLLDYKLACDERYTGVMEEILCQTMDLPPNLLPMLS